MSALVCPRPYCGGRLLEDADGDGALKCLTCARLFAWAFGELAQLTPERTPIPEPPRRRGRPREERGR